MLMVQDWVPLYRFGGLLVKLRDTCGKKFGEGEDIRELGNR